METLEPKLLLEMRIEVDPGWVRNYKREFAKVARSYRIEFRPYFFPMERLGEKVPKSYYDDVARASGYWIRHPGLLSDEATYDVVSKRLHAGEAWVIVEFDSNYATEQNEFLKQFGVQGTHVGAFRNPDARSEHQRLIFLNREEFPASFRDPLLFDGVGELAVSGVQGLLHSGVAQSVLAIPDRHVQLVDISKDYFAEWPVAELSCMAVWRPQRGHGGLLVLSGSALSDPTELVFGHWHPGIDASDNRRFARNLLRLVADLPTPVPFNWTAASGLLSQIESNCYLVTRRILEQGFGENWWDKGVPDSIREMCRRKKEGERGQFPEPAYLDFIDYKKIWSTNWAQFEALLSEVSSPTVDKNFFLSQFQNANPIRIKIAHPTKVVVTGQGRPSDEERQLLEAMARAFVQMLNRIEGLNAVA